MQPAEHEGDDPASRQHIPPPEPMQGDEARYDTSRGTTRFLGASTLFVPPVTLIRSHSEPESSFAVPSSSENGAGNDTMASAAPTGKEVQFWEFELEYTPLRVGFVPVGGLRCLLLEDQVQGAEEAYPEKRSSGAPVVLKEWDVIGEVWVKS